MLWVWIKVANYLSDPRFAAAVAMPTAVASRLWLFKLIPAVPSPQMIEFQITSECIVVI